MIITIKGSQRDIFKDNNIGTLYTYQIRYTLGLGASYSGASQVDRNTAFSATINLDEGYDVGVGGVVVTMGGVTLDAAQVVVIDETTNTITITIAEVTGGVFINVPTVRENVTPEPEQPVTPTTYTITYVYIDGSGATVKTSDTETVTAGTVKNFATTDSRATVDGYTCNSVSPTSATVNEDITVTYTYTANEAGDSSSTNVTLTITPDPADAKVIFMKGNSTLTATNNTVSVPNGSKVSVQVSKNGYITVNTSYTLTSNRSETITLTEASDTIVVTEYPYVVTTWEQGSYSGAGLSTEVGRIRAGYFSVEPNSTIDMQLNGDWQGYICYPTSTAHALMGTQSWTQSEIFNVGSHNEKVLIVLKNTSNTKITPSDYSEADGGVITINAPVAKETVTTYTSSDLVVGGLTTSTATVNTSEKNRLRTGLLECQANDTVKVTLPEGLVCYVAYMETGVVPMKYSSWSAAGATVEIPVPYTGSFCVVIAYSDKTTKFSDTSAFTGTIELLR